MFMKKKATINVSISLFLYDISLPLCDLCELWRALIAQEEQSGLSTTSCFCFFFTLTNSYSLSDNLCIYCTCLLAIYFNSSDKLLAALACVSCFLFFPCVLNFPSLLSSICALKHLFLIVSIIVLFNIFLKISIYITFFLHNILSIRQLNYIASSVFSRCKKIVQH